MKEQKQRPILFSTPMVRAILEGRKTQTRRIVKSRTEGGFQVSSAKYEPDYYGYYHNKTVRAIDAEESYVKDILCPYGEVGDTLWVRETWANLTYGESSFYGYKADNGHNPERKWKPSIFMPRDACRIHLEITDIKVERLQEISEEDAIAEGIERYIYSGLSSYYAYKDYLDREPQSENDILNAKESYQSLWQKINGSESWNNNPFVWCITFKTT